MGSFSRDTKGVRWVGPMLRRTPYLELAIAKPYSGSTLPENRKQVDYPTKHFARPGKESSLAHLEQASLVGHGFRHILVRKSEAVVSSAGCQPELPIAVDSRHEKSPTKKAWTCAARFWKLSLCSSMFGGRIQNWLPQPWWLLCFFRVPLLGRSQRQAPRKPSKFESPSPYGAYPLCTSQQRLKVCRVPTRNALQTKSSSFAAYKKNRSGTKHEKLGDKQKKGRADFP